MKKYLEVAENMKNLLDLKDIYIQAGWLSGPHPFVPKKKHAFDLRLIPLIVTYAVINVVRYGMSC